MDLVILAPLLLVSFVAHEYAHAWVAMREGDLTAYRLGRVTLNPIPHIDLFGTILVPALLIASNTGFLVGWAKPVPVDPANFRDYRRGDIRVSLAGVTANFVIAVACTALAVAVIHVERLMPGVSRAGQVALDVLGMGITLNYILVVFNLLPVPPLDGSRLVVHFLPAPAAAVWRRFERFGMLLFVLLLVTDGIRWVLWPAFAAADVSWAVVGWLT